MSVASPDRHVGRVLGGQYRVEALLGSGGMGAVYRGTQLSVQRAVAIKLIGTGHPDPEHTFLRFRREAEATARLNHPNTVRLFDFGMTETHELFMVMELLEGCDLAARLQRGPLPLADALRVVRQVLAALSEAHALGIVHRDLKPGNVFLSRVQGGDSFVKVMDFGIAGIAAGHDAQRITVTGAVMGTPAYMSPEQAQGKPVDARSDLYSIGVMLFEMLTGKPLFEADTLVSMLVAHVTQPPRPLAQAGAHFPELPRVQALLDRLLAKQAADRFGSAAEVAQHVEALLGSLQPQTTDSFAAPPSAASAQQTDLSLTAAAPQPSQPLTPLHWNRDGSRRRRGSVWTLAALGALTGLAAGAALWLTREPPGAPPLTAAESDTRAATSLNAAPPAREERAPDPASPHGDAERPEARVKNKVIASDSQAPNASSALKPAPGAATADTRVPPPAPGATADTRVPTPARGATALPPAPGATADTRVPTPARGATSDERAQSAAASDGRGSSLPPSAADGSNVSGEQTAPLSAADKGKKGRNEREGRAARARHNASAREAEPAEPAASVADESQVAAAESPPARRRAETTRSNAAAPSIDLSRAPPYPSMAAARRALDSGKINTAAYESAIALLKARRTQRLALERENLQKGAITPQEYEWRLGRIDAEYRGE